MSGRKRIVPGPSHRESERPVYFLEILSGFACSWFATEAGSLILQPHPLSLERVRIVSVDDIDVMGQVVPVAMRLASPATTEECS